jgi:PAS domain S-box-containing protein
MASSARDRFRAFLESGALKVALVYLVVGLAWIFFSDNIAFAITGGSDAFLLYSELKGFGFIIVTTLMLYGLIRYFTDASEKQQQQLYRYENRYRKLYESMMDAFVHVDMAGWIKEYNPAFREMLGYSDEELSKSTYRDITPGKWHEPEEKILKEQVLLLGYSEVYEKEFRRKDGTIFPVELHTFLLRDDTGQPAGLGTIVRDITGRKRAEEALRESEERFRKIFENSPLGMTLVTSDYRFFSVNPAWIAMTGYAEEELLKMSFKDITHPDHRASDDEHMRELAAGTIPVYGTEKRYIRKDGSILWGSIRVTAIRDQQGSLRYFAGQIEDITERKMAQDALNRATKKLSLLNSITFSDIQNAIFSLAGYFELEKTGEPGERLQQYLDKEIEIIRTITESLEFAKNYQNLGLKPPAWQDVGEAFLFGISHLDISDISRKLSVEGVEIYADPLLENVFFTLAENILLHGKTATEISFRYQESEEGLTLFFEDNGEGIHSDLKEKIFDRRNEERKGMGLFLVREILSVTGITIRETGEPGKGARFEISVPKGAYRFEGRP